MNPTTSTSTTSARARQRKPGAWRKLIPWLIAAALVIAVGGGLMPKPIPVETATVSTGPLVVSVLEEGKTRIRHRFTISPPVAGSLERIPLRAGDRIVAGETVLATIQAQPSGFLDPRARAQAEARLKAAEATQSQSESELERTRASLELAEKEKARAVDLKRSGAISTKEWDATDNQVTMLSRALHSAEFASRVAGFEVVQAQAALVEASSAAGTQSPPLKIVAPVTGFVLQIFEESARTVTAGMPIMEVGDPQDLEAEIELLSSDAVGVQTGAEVSIEQWGGDAPLRGKVSVVEPGGYTKISALGVEEQRVKVRVDFVDPFPPERVMGDRFRVEARIVTWRGESVLQVPTGALFRRGNEWMTFRIDGGKAHVAKVEIAHNNGAAAEIRSGLTQDQRVILHPPDAVTEGISVTPRK